MFSILSYMLINSACNISNDLKHCFSMIVLMGKWDDNWLSMKKVHILLLFVITVFAWLHFAMLQQANGQQLLCFYHFQKKGTGFPFLQSGSEIRFEYQVIIWWNKLSFEKLVEWWNQKPEYSWYKLFLWLVCLKFCVYNKSSPIIIERVNKNPYLLSSLPIS